MCANESLTLSEGAAVWSGCPPNLVLQLACAMSSDRRQQAPWKMSGRCPRILKRRLGGTPSAELEWSRKLCSGMMCLIGGRCMSQIFCRLHSQFSIWQLSREPFAPVPPFVHGEGSGKDCARGFGGKVLLQVAERFQNGTGYSGKRCWSFDNPYLSRDMRV